MVTSPQAPTVAQTQPVNTKDPEGFVYLKSKPTASVRGIPNFYDLEECDFTEASDNYFTLSSTGVTHISEGGTELTPLPVWEREKQIFSRIVGIPFFHHFRLWKSFVTWRGTVRSRKMGRAKNALSKSLFALDPNIRHALFEVRQRCEDICLIRPIDVAADPQSLDDFETRQVEACDAAGQTIDGHVTDIANLVLDACEKVMTAAGFGIPTVEEAKEKKKETYTEQALKRAECRRLTNFIRLADYLIVNALYNMAIQSQRAMLDRMRAASATLLPQSVEYSDVGLTLVSQAVPDDTEPAIPVFLADVTLDDDDMLRTSPLGAQLIHKIDAALDEMVTLADNVQRLTTHPAFDQYTRTGAGDGGEAPDAPSVQMMFSVNPEFTELAAEMRSVIDTTARSATAFLGDFGRVVEVYSTGLKRDVSTELATIEADVDGYKALLSAVSADVQLMESIPAFTDCGPLRVSLEGLVAQFAPVTQRVQADLHAALPGVVHGIAAELMGTLNVADGALARPPTDVATFVTYLDFLDDAVTRIDTWNGEYDRCRLLYETLEAAKIPAPAEDLAEFQTLTETVQQLRASISFSEQNRDSNITRFSAELEGLVETFRQDVTGLRTDAQATQFDTVENVEHAPAILNAATDLKKRLSEMQARAKDYEEFHDKFNMPQPKLQDVEDVAAIVNLKHQLWETLATWDDTADEWLATSFNELDTDAIQARVTRASKTVFMLDKGLPGSPVVPVVRSKVDRIKAALPVAVDLHNPALEPRHWAKVKDTLGQDVPEGEAFTFGWLLDNGALDHADAINGITVEASNEATLLGMIQKIEEKWAPTELVLVSHRDQANVFILSQLDDVMAQLEDNLVTVGTMRASRFAYAVGDQLDLWDSRLNVFSDTLDEWIAFQKNWLYLEVIFGAADIQRQLPTEAKLFDAADKFWKAIMVSTHDFPNALEACTKEGLCAEFKAHNGTLEKIQKSLEEYLETKCMAFPRFYFLSNDELLEILAQTRDPRAVQPHLRKAFDNLFRLEFAANGVDILSMASGEEEVVTLQVPGKTLKARGPVESWLSAVEKAMRDSLHRLMRQCIEDYATQDHAHWVRSHAAQLIIAAEQVYWAREITAALESDDAPAALADYKQRWAAHLGGLVEMVRSNLTKLERAALTALITIDVHSRDTLDELIDSGASHIADFEWTKRLRYYWEPSEDECIIRQTSAEFRYSYEYLGCSMRLVITPLTDRCYITLTSALQLRLGGAPAGPAGTGKTETTKDLAKAMAMQCVVFKYVYIFIPFYPAALTV